METWSDLHSLIGRQVAGANGSSLGRVVAIIHRATGADILLERRSWLRLHCVRIPADRLEEVPGEGLVCMSLAGGGRRRRARVRGPVRTARRGV